MAKKLKHALPAPPPPPADQQARIAVQMGQHVSISAEIRVTSGGLLAIGALVSGILLSTAVVVRAARLPHRP